MRTRETNPTVRATGRRPSPARTTITPRPEAQPGPRADLLEVNPEYDRYVWELVWSDCGYS